MADVLHKITKQYLLSVNTPDYMDGEWLINPDISVVDGLPLKYWIIESDELRAATTEEREYIDAVEEFNGMTTAQIKARLNTKINTYRDNYINCGVVYMGHLFDSDDRARENILGMCSAISLGINLPENFTWRSRLNVDVPMNATQLTIFGIGVLTFVSACFSASWYHKDSINAMTTDTVMDYVEYDYMIGWPSRSLDGSTI